MRDGSGMGVGMIGGGMRLEDAAFSSHEDLKNEQKFVEH